MFTPGIPPFVWWGRNRENPEKKPRCLEKEERHQHLNINTHPACSRDTFPSFKSIILSFNSILISTPSQCLTGQRAFTVCHFSDQHSAQIGWQRKEARYLCKPVWDWNHNYTASRFPEISLLFVPTNIRNYLLKAAVINLLVCMGVGKSQPCLSSAFCPFPVAFGTSTAPTFSYHVSLNPQTNSCGRLNTKLPQGKMENILDPRIEI